MLAVSIISLAITLGIVATKVAVGISAYDSLKSALSITNLDKIKNFDQPVTDIMGQCLLLLSRFMDYLQILVVLCSFLCIVFNSFKLWAGTVEIKKSFVDMVYKCVMVTALMLIWPTVVTKTYTFATKIGVEASGGTELLTSSYASVAVNTQQAIKAGMNDYIDALTKGLEKKDGKFVLSNNAMKGFTDMGFSESEAKTFLAKYNIEFDPSVSSGFWIFKNKQGRAEDNARREMNAEGVDRNQTGITGPSYWGTSRENYIKQNIAMLRTFSEVLTGIPENNLGEVDIAQILSMSEEGLESVFYNPFVEGSDDRLSMSTMLKTSILLSKAFAEGSLAPFDDFSKYSDDEISKNAEDYFNHQNMPFVMKIIGSIARYFVYNLGMVLSTLFVMLEYSITFIEYLLVASVSALLIPFFFIDATKQFVTNLLKMIFSYFIKLLVTTMMCFFVMGMYMRMAETLYGQIFSDTITVIYYVFILVLGLMLAKSSGKVASAVISGNPSLGIGDIAHQMSGMSHAMHSGMRAAEGLGRDMQKVGAAGKKVAHEGGLSSAANKSILDGQEVAGRNVAEGLLAQRGKENYKYWNSDAGRARLSDLQSRAKTNPQSLSDAEKSSLEQGERAMNLTNDKIRQAAKEAGREYAGQARKQFNKERMYNALTGIDRAADSSNALRVGQMFKDETGQHRQATWDDVQDAGKKSADAWSKQYLKDHGMSTSPDKSIKDPENGI